MNDQMADINRWLPHREPFLFVERVEEATDERIVGYRRFVPEDFFFRGHFPEYPVVPGVILVETMAQVGGAGVKKLGKVKADGMFFLASVDKVKFRRQVRPGEEVRVVIQNLRVSNKMVKQSGQVFVGEEIAAEAEWLCLVG
jgi:3-hydroxyacyl-[acyl-carrier-protein] dehydratase